MSHTKSTHSKYSFFSEIQPLPRQWYGFLGSASPLPLLHSNILQISLRIHLQNRRGRRNECWNLNENEKKKKLLHPDTFSRHFLWQNRLSKVLFGITQNPRFFFWQNQLSNTAWSRNITQFFSGFENSKAWVWWRYGELFQKGMCFLMLRFWFFNFRLN